MVIICWLSLVQAKPPEGLDDPDESEVPEFLNYEQDDLGENSQPSRQSYNPFITKMNFMYRA